MAALDAVHDRIAFDCGSAALNCYFQQQVTQDIRRKVTACFVALTREQHVAGYYTLASPSVPLVDLPTDIGKKPPPLPFRAGRTHGTPGGCPRVQGTRTGRRPARRCAGTRRRSEVAACALVVDAKDESAADFCQHHGFIALPCAPMTLFLPFSALPGLHAVDSGIRPRL